jgi:hypothetical protein
MSPVVTQEDKKDEFDEQATEEGIKSAKALVQSFLQTVKGYRLYEANHPILTKFLEKLKNDFDQYFAGYAAFALQVGEHQLLYHGNIVYESADVKESLAFLFFKDGVREIRFHKGLEFSEILDFLTVVRKSDMVNRMEDDLVTLLWEKDFTHITFATIDEFLEKGGMFVPATEEDLMLGMGQRELETHDHHEMAEGPEASGLLLGTGEDLKQALNASPGQSLVDACALSPVEIDKINEELQRENQPGYLLTLIDSLIEILLHLGEDMDAYENMISYFERIVQSLLEQEQMEKVVMILTRLKETMESMVLKDKQIFAFRRIFEASTNPESVKLLGKAIQNNGEGKSEPIISYLGFMTDKAVFPLCMLLGELDSGKWRKILCDLLIQLSGKEIQPLVKFLSDRNPVVVSQMLYILGKIKHPSTVKYLGPVVTYPDLKVREEVLQVITKFGEKGKDLLLKLLRDPVPGIRGKASIAVARVAKAQALKPLTEIILSEDFHKRDYEEKVAFFRALGETGSKEAIPILEQIANKRTWFKKAKWEEMKTCAAHALRMMQVDQRQAAEASARPSRLANR